MAATTSEDLTIDMSVSDFLIRHGAEQEFRKLCELVRASFPALLGLEMHLQEDPDEDSRAQVVVCAKLPEVCRDYELARPINRRAAQSSVRESRALVADFQAALAALPPMQIVDGARKHLQSIGRLGRQP